MARYTLTRTKISHAICTVQAVEALKSLSAYYDMLQNRKIVSGPTISYLEDACYRCARRWLDSCFRFSCMALDVPPRGV